MRFFRHTLGQVTVGDGDSVIGGAAIPSDSKLNAVLGQVHIQSLLAVSIAKAIMYGCDGRVLVHTDPDSVTGYNTMWDQQVDKDVDVSLGILDIGENTDSNPFFEPGEPNVNQIAGMSISSDERFFRRRKMISFQSAPRGFIDGAPDTYWPGDVFRVNARPRIGVKDWSVAMMAVAEPAMDDVTTTAWLTPTGEAEWMQAKYMEVVLEQAWMELVGLTETGAETPWEDAALEIEEILEPTVVEVTAGSFASDGLIVFANLSWDITVPGRRTFGALSAAG